MPHQVTFRAAVAAAILAAGAGAHAATLINPGLELLAGDSGTTVSVLGGNSYNGWTNPGGPDIEFVGVIPGILEPSDEGGAFVDLNGVTGFGSLQQTLGDTFNGEVYRITFALSGNPGASGEHHMPKPVTVSWNGVDVDTFTFIHLGTDMFDNLRWEDHSVVVTASGLDTLRFTSGGGNVDAGPMIDNIRIENISVPAPAALPAGLALMAWVGLRRRR